MKVILKALRKKCIKVQFLFLSYCFTCTSEVECLPYPQFGYPLSSNLLFMISQQFNIIPQIE